MLVWSEETRWNSKKKAQREGPNEQRDLTALGGGEEETEGILLSYDGRTKDWLPS